MAPTFFPSAAHFRAWLTAHADTVPELEVGFYRVDSGQPSLTWPEAVDEALCVGWIDGVRRRIDATAYQIRFTPRRRGSIWSAVNLARAEALVAGGRMQPAGQEAYARRTEGKSGRYSYEQRGDVELTPEERAVFRQDQAAWAYFESAPPGYRKMMLYWVASPKKAETRARRLATFMEACAAGVRLFRS